MRGLGRARRPAIAAVALSLSLVTACSGGGSGDESDGGEGGSKTLVYAAAGVPGQLDVWTQYEGDSSRTQQYEWASTLVEYDASDLPDNGCDVLPGTEDLRPHLAESWEYNDDQSQLLFTLRDGVESAAGNEMTAEDVVWSLDRARKQSTIVQFLMSSVADFPEKNAFEVVDDHTVAVNLNQPTAMDVVVFTYPMLGVLDSKTVQEEAGGSDPLGNEWLKTHTANFGPWQLEDFTPSEEVVYTANPNYFDEESRGNIGKLIIRSVPDSATRLQLLDTGQAGYAERLSFDQYENLDQSGDANVLNCASPNRDTLLLNEKFEPFADRDVRKAISQAIDRDALVTGVYKGYAKPAKYGVSDVYWEPPADAATIEFDPESAKQLLSDAGVDDLSFAIVASPTRPGAYAQSLAVQIQSMLKEVGVTAEIDVVAGATEFSDRFFDSNYEAMIYLEPPAIGDPFYSTQLYSSTESFQNTFGYSNPDYDKAVNALLVTPPGDERNQVVKTINDIIVDDAPQVYLTDNRYVHALGSDVSGYENTPHGQPMTYLWSID